MAITRDKRLTKQNSLVLTTEINLRSFSNGCSTVAITAAQHSTHDKRNYRILVRTCYGLRDYRRDPADATLSAGISTPAACGNLKDKIFRL